VVDAASVVWLADPVALSVSLLESAAGTKNRQAVIRDVLPRILGKLRHREDDRLRDRRSL